MDVEKAWDEAKAEPGWPPHIKPMTFAATSKWGFDRKGNMYFNHQPLEFSRKIKFSLEQSIFAGLTALGVFFGGFAALIQALQ